MLEEPSKALAIRLKRKACQVKVTPELDGLVVQMPEKQI